jgi:hypothetical protein
VLSCAFVQHKGLSTWALHALDPGRSGKPASSQLTLAFTSGY